MPDITRLFKGAKNDFEVEVVWSVKGEASTNEAHPFEEIVVLLEGGLDIALNNGDKNQIMKPNDLFVMPPGTYHVITSTADSKLLVVHTHRNV